MRKERAEAFSDGVMAVAITLLVLDLHVDVEGHGNLLHQIGLNWPAYAAYVVSFFVIGVIWINHHALFALIDEVDRLLLFWNLILLLAVTSLPFATSVLADYLRVGGSDARTAVVIYGIANELMSVGFTLVLHRMIRARLLRVPVSPERARTALVRFCIGLLLYPLVTVVGLFSPQVMLVLYALISGYYVFEQTPILGREPDLTPGS
jgi:uncharacterized membrane protein